MLRGHMPMPKLTMNTKDACRQRREKDAEDALYNEKVDAEERVYNETIDAEERAQKQAAQEHQPALSLGHIVRYPEEVPVTE